MVFLDYASTNPWPKYRCSDYYRPLFNVNTNYAFAEKRMLDESEERVKKAIGAKSGKVVFGGTSSQLIENLFTHITEETNEYLTICSIYEHDAMWRFADQWGNIDSLKHVIQTYHGDKRLIVSLMGINNLTGEIFPVEGIGRLCKDHGAFFVCDMTAMIGHTVIPANLNDWCSCVVYSGHKIGTELGIGAMWLSEDFNDWLKGFKLYGTPNLAGALALTQAVEDACDRDAIAKRNEHWLYLFKGLGLSLINNGITWIGVDRREWETGTFAINAIRLPGFNADALQQYLSSKQIYVSIGGSACAEKHDYRILETGYNLTKQEASEVIRISFGENSTVEEIKVLVEQIKNFKELYLK